MGKSSDSVTVGFRYYVGMHQVYCHGPVDAVTKVRVGEKEVWTGNVTGSQQISINAPEAFGGDGKEGGVVGAVDVAMGAAGQTPNDYLAAKLTGHPLPSFRGVLSLILRQVHVSSMNPYIKPWSIFARRIPQSWYAAKAVIGGVDANPAHIIRELLTSTAYGMGYAAADIDDVSFTAAADTLYNEGLGLSIVWSERQSIEDFIALVLDYVDGVLYVKPATGKYTLKLARKDYSVNDLLILDPSNVLSVERYAQPLLGEMANEVMLTYLDRDTGKPGSVTVQDIALLEIQGGQKISVKLDLPGIPTAALATKIASRELSQVSIPLARATLIANREAWNLNIGDVFRWRWAPYGISEMVMRIAGISYGTLTNGQIRIDCVQDVFIAAQESYIAPTPYTWTDPWNPPAAIPNSAVIETPYWELARRVVGESGSRWLDIDPDAGLVTSLGDRPSEDAYDFRHWTKNGSTYTSQKTGDYCPSAVLNNDITRHSVFVTFINAKDIDDVEPNTWAMIGDEMVKIKTISSGSMTVSRGVLDTVPASHAAGTAILFGEGTGGVDPVEYASGQTVEVKQTTRTGKGALSTAAAPAQSVTLNSRYIRPYAPANVKVNGDTYPDIVNGDLTITWATRNRIQQTAYLVEQDEASITPETGQTTTIRIYNAQTGGSLIRTYAGLTGTSQSYTEAQATTDNGGSKPANIRIEIESVRDSYTSWQKQVIQSSWT